MELKPLRKVDGKAVARAFEELILFRWEMPNYLLTDNGREFANKQLDTILSEYGVQYVTTPPYHLQANPVERSNSTLKTMLATFVRSGHRDWDAHLHEFRHAVNTALQSTLKATPAFLNYDKHPRPVKSLRRETVGVTPRVRLAPEVWKERMMGLEALRDLVARNIDRAREKQAGYYNRGRRDIRFFVGDLVMRRTHPLSNAAQKFSAKLAPKYEGFYEITEALSPRFTY